MDWPPPTMHRLCLSTLELRFDPQAHTVAYRWQADEPGFSMPIAGDQNHWQLITQVTTQWQTMATPGDPDQFDVATDLYYVNVRKL